MKRFFCLLFFTVLGFSSQAQEKVQWEVTYSPVTNSVIFNATIAEGWHLYSQFIKNDIGPVPTSFTFEDNATVTLTGNVTEPTPIREYDENFEANLDFFKTKVTFTQLVKKGSNGVLKGTITYMICNDVMCLPPVDYVFEVKIP